MTDGLASSRRLSSSSVSQQKPGNLRFQRRQNERAYIEGAYRGSTPTMDYPSGTSPWASSPDASRTTFQDDVPRDNLSNSVAGLSGDQGGRLTTVVAPSDFVDSQEGPWTSEHQNQWQSEQHESEDAGDVEEHQQQQDEVQQQLQKQESPQKGVQQPQPHQQPQPGTSGILGEEQRKPSSASRYRNAQQQQQRQHMPQYKLQAKITALERTGKKDPILRFDVYTNLPKFRTTQFRDIRRTHSEFQKLASHLTASNPEALVPAVPPASTSAGIGTDEDETRTKTALQRWLNVVCSNEVLMRDEEMVFFVESDFGYSPVVRKKQPATGVRRKVIKQFAPPPDDTPELLESRPIVKAFYLGTMDCQQRVDRVVKCRRSLGVAESDQGTRIQALAIQEMHTGLANAYRKLGKVVQNTGDFHAAQGTAEATTLHDPLAYHSRDAFIVKETLTNRHILLRELMQAQQAHRSKITAAERLKASSSVKREKVEEAITVLEEAKSHERYLEQKTERVTQNLLVEKRKWFARTAADMRASIREYVIREIEAERRTLATLEQVRPDVRNVDASGGLSRLGREAHPIVRRSGMASSQGPKGDAWSGVPRRPDGLNRNISGPFIGGIAGVVPEDDDVEGLVEAGKGRRRNPGSAGSMGKVLEDDDDDRVDARNAASRLAQTTW